MLLTRPPKMIIAVSLALGATGAVQSLPATVHATEATASARPPVIPVTVTSAGFCAGGPDPRPAGPVTFRVGTPDVQGRWWAVMRLRGSATMEQVAKEFADSYSGDPAVARPALRAIYRDVEFNGGASVFPTGTVSVTTELRKGTYYLSDTALEGATDGCGEGATHLQRLRVGEERRSSVPPRANAVVEARETGDGQRFVMPGVLPAHAVVRVTNHTRQPHEVIIVGVLPTTTDADVQAYFDAQSRGDLSVPSPFLATVGGMLAISPGHKAVFQIDVPPGRYSVLSFVRNPATGVKSASEGMHKTVTFR